MKEIIIKLLEEQLKNLNVHSTSEEIKDVLVVPPSDEMGDYTFPCFILSKILKQNPAHLAGLLAEQMENKKVEEIEKIEVKGPYLNFFVNKGILAQNVIRDVEQKKENFCKGNKKIGKIMVEFPAPNTNKPLHLGHLRNMAVGESMSRILEFNNNRVIRANLNNDRGIHICKSMLAYQKFGSNKEPDKKSDHFVGDFYVLYNQKVKEDDSLEHEVVEMLRKWEAGDKEVIGLWKKMNKWALDGFDRTYKTFGIKHDKNYYEHKIYNKGKEIVAEGLKKGIFEKRDDGAVIINLEKEGFDEKVLMRADGTSIYMTQDLYLAKLKDDEYHLDGSIYVVGNEQEYHFKILFLILKKLGFKFAENLIHLSYGMVILPEGKMKSREGKVVDADDLLDEINSLARKELESRYKLPGKELKRRSHRITMAALNYNLLKVDVFKNMIFNPKESINFEGNTGPYILYAYARASSIVRKYKKTISYDSPVKLVEEAETRLVKKINEFPGVVEQAAEKYNPSLIAHYSYDLARTFNEFYHTCPVLNSDNEAARIRLIEAFRLILKNSLYLLVIEPIEEM
jgi:arginyl-tRNA synthetase